MKNNQSTQPFVAVVGTPDRASFADTMLKDITEGLCANGLRARQFTLTAVADLPLLQKKISVIAENEPHRFLVDLNGNFNAKLTSDHYASLRFSYLLDHPFRHAHKFEDYGGTMIAGIVDATHKNAFTDLGKKTQAIFLPHAGPPPQANPLPISARTIDVLFVGNISPLLYQSHFEERICGLPDYCVRIIDRAVSLTLEERLYPYDAFRAAILQEFPEGLRNVPLVELREMFIVVETLLASRQRFEALKILARMNGVNIHLVGNIAEILERDARWVKGDRVTIHGHIPFDRVLTMIAQAKIVINANFTIVGGSHERIWQAMANGSVILTNDSLYMRSCFEDGTNMLLFPEQLTDLPTLLHAHLDNPAKLQAMADNAVAIYERYHTWKARLAPLADLFRSAAQDN